MTTLIKIKSAPPWHQSTELLTSCPVFYVEASINGHALPGGMDSARGTQVHRTGAAYAAHCALKGVSVDLEEFDRLAAGAGPEAARILSGVRDSLEIDHEHLLGTEITFSLDGNFRPTRIVDAIAGACEDSGKDPVVVGTTDQIYSFPEQAFMRIDDWKTHPSPFDPTETLQAKTYALFCFMHFAWVQKLIFRLVFVRYKKLTREVEFTRDQIPRLMEAIFAARQRQLSIHEAFERGEKMEAVAGNHCWYCPLLSNAKCPIAQYNANMQLTMPQRLNFNLWYSQFSRANNAVMKAYLKETGKRIVLNDFNGKAYTYGYEDRQAEVYPVFRFDADGLQMIEATGQPVMPIIDLLSSYAYSTPDDIDWLKNVVISSTSINKYRHAKKRVMLDQALEDTVEKVPKTRLCVSKPLDAVPEEEVYDEEEEEWEEEL